MTKQIAVAVLGLLACTSSASAQTTQLKQTAAGPNCQIVGCINAPLSDGELFTFSDTLKYLGSYPINGKLAFRGLNYFLSGHSSGYEVIDLDASAWENNGFAVHENFAPCYRCFRWHDGYLQVANEYVGFDPYLYGYNGAVNVTSGTGQVGLVTASPFPLTVTLASSDTTQIQVPSEVTIPAGSLDADFTIMATAPTQTTPPSPTAKITIIATFPDGTSAVATVTVQPLPAPPPPEQ